MYRKTSRFININTHAVSVISKVLQEKKIPYLKTTTWSTDGFFRETAELVKYRISEGREVVEMECSALAAVAQLRNVVWGELLFTVDTLAKLEKYDRRNFGDVAFEQALELALDCVVEL